MATSGVQIKKNAKGKTTHVTIDVRKHPEIISSLKEQGLLPKSQWEIESADCASVEEAFEQVSKTIKDFYANRR